ncbi:MAG TPA: methyltransferase domain-containing protein [Blastocatellia bacterium]
MIVDSTAAGFDDYIMGRTSDEYQRLRRQAQLWEDATMRILQKTGLRAGMSCLDVGCGPGEVMRLMGEMVGVGGSVTGLDADGALGRDALAALNATAISRFSFVECDLETIDQPPGRPFDLVFARLILVHVADPLSLLRKMYSWVKPGGYLVAQEYNLRTPDIYPRPATWPEFEKIITLFEKVGRDLNVGLKLPAYFAEAGLGQADGTDVAAYAWPLTQTIDFFLGAYGALLPRLLQKGLTTEAQSRAFIDEMNHAAASEKYYSTLSPLLIGAWKRKPV